MLGSSHKQPLFFVLERQENRTVFLTEAVKPPGECYLVEKVLNQLTYLSIGEWYFQPVNKIQTTCFFSCNQKLQVI